MPKSRLLMAALYVIAGTLHFILTPLYIAIMPPYFPAHRALVLISGAAEIAGGLGLLIPIPAIQRAAAWGIFALLVAVYPANLYMAANPTAFPTIPLWIIWARLPIQIPLLYWAWLYTRSPRSTAAQA